MNVINKDIIMRERLKQAQMAIHIAREKKYHNLFALANVNKIKPK